MTLPIEIERVAAMGWHLYPSVVGGKAASFPGASDAATCDVEILREWEAEFNHPNWRVVFGPSNLIGLDLDVPPGHSHDGVAALAALAERNGGIPPRPTARSGGGGLGLFWRAPAVPIRGDTGHPAPGCDPRRGRQSQTIPPSRHWRTGAPYRWIIAPWDVPPPECPEWLVALIRQPPPPPPRPAPPLIGDGAKRRYAVAAIRMAIQRVATAPGGQANDTLNREAWAMARFLADGSLSEPEILDGLLSGARVRGIPIREATATIHSGMKARRT